MKLTLSSDARAWAQKRYTLQFRKWLSGDLASFPQILSLGNVTEKDFVNAQQQVRAWHADWSQWVGPGTLEWETYRWPSIGQHKLPARLVLATPEEFSALCGQKSGWASVNARLEQFASLTGLQRGQLAGLRDIFLEYSAPDWVSFTACVAYFQANPKCDMYIRQLPIHGVDTKWVGLHLADLTRALRLARGVESNDFYAITGVRPPEHLNQVTVKVLCPKLRAQMGGVELVAVTVASLRNWSLRPTNVLFVENLESGIALQDLPDTVAFIGKGNAVLSLSDIEWLQSSRLVYWGDLDTHGLAIFGRLRARLPQLTPVLMDIGTLQAYRPLWTREEMPHPPVAGLPFEQQTVFDFLLDNGNKGVRLEQERIPWSTAWAAVQAAVQAN